MALLADTLATELKAMALFDNEADAIDAWAEAFSTYFEDAASAVLGASPILAAAIPPAETLMKAGMTGLSTAGPAAIQAGIVAFWGSLVANVSNPVTQAWATVTLIVPPVLLTGIAAALTTLFATNTAGSVAKDAAFDAIAASIHTNNQGGLATWPNPVLVQAIL